MHTTDNAFSVRSNVNTITFDIGNLYPQKFIAVPRVPKQIKNLINKNWFFFFHFFIADFDLPNSNLFFKHTIVIKGDYDNSFR